MHSSEERAIAIVGVGAILPDAPNAPAFWTNIINKKYSITEVPPERWSAVDYYDPDPSTPDKTYTTLGGWVRGFEFDWRRFRMPPKMAGAMDQGQKWAVTIAAEALADYGYPERPLNTENTAVILGTAMGGERHYITHERIAFPQYANALKETASFQQLPDTVQDGILSQWHSHIAEVYPPITEDSMPGELPNIVSGRVANILNLRGANFITDAACASSFAAINAAIELLVENQADAVLTGGVDHNMGISPFVKFCKIGALSATGSRPFGAGADGFIMGEGSAAFLLKRLEDAERNGDKIYAVIRGIGGASDGRGKGITAPNPIGQRLAVERAWQNAGVDPASATLVEAHGTSTRVGDVVEVESLSAVFGSAAPGSIGLGSAKSNIGHLKAGAGAAGLLKAVMALHHKTLPPTLNAQEPNPNIDFQQTPFYLLHEAQEWSPTNGAPRRCGVSAYGFGGTNFHLVLEEHIPGALTRPARATATTRTQQSALPPENRDARRAHRPAPLRGILALGAATPAGLQDALEAALRRVETGWAPPKSLLPKPEVIGAQERLIIDFADRSELLDRLQKARKIMDHDNQAAWKAIEAQGIFRGHGRAPGKIAFLFPGQGSQYVNMGRELVELSPVVAEVFAEADEIMQPILGRPLTDYIFVDPDDSQAMMQAQFGLMQTEITQPAMLTLDIAVMKLLAEYGFEPDMVMGHSLGEYAGLIAAGAMPFADALEATAARGSEMSKVSWDDNGKMAAIIAPFDVVTQTLAEVDGYVIPANINSHSQCVIGGASKAVEAACARFEEAGYRAIQIPVSHAFHTEIVAPASGPLREVLDRLHVYEPRLPVVANLTGAFYPQTPEQIKDVLQQQVASTVQWVKGLETLYDAGVRTFVEVGPKRALRGFARDVFSDKDDVVALMTLHPKTGELPAFNQALCGLFAAGYAGDDSNVYVSLSPAAAMPPATDERPEPLSQQIPASEPGISSPASLSSLITTAVQQALQENGFSAAPSRQVYDRNREPIGSVVISGTGLGLPGAEKAVMDPDNAQRILRGEQFVDLIPERFRRRMVDKRITRLVKAADGNGRLVTITDPAEVIKLAGRPGTFDLAGEYGVPEKLVEALDITSQLAIAAGIDALREAGIPLVQTYRRTTTGKFLPDRWLLPESLRDETGVIFASAFPGGDQFAAEFARYYQWQSRLDMLETLEELRQQASDDQTLAEISRRLAQIRAELAQNPYTFDRRFLFRILSMGHSQFAQYIGARGPNTQVNAACASTTQAVALAEDWIRSGRCRRVVVIGGDAVTSNHLMEWVGAGFLAVGAATTKDRVDEAALPFDRRRHGTIIGMGACALLVESEDALQERGMRGIAELLSSETSNSAFHGTRLDVEHITQVMDHLLTAAERRFGLHRHAVAASTAFMSHETFTPARGGSAAAEIEALRQNFGDAAHEIIIANTKGFTGHPMGVGVEDVIAVKILEYGLVPPVPNFKEVDPELGLLNLSRGGRYPIQYVLHLAAGFGSQIAMSLLRRIPGALDRVDDPAIYDHWLAEISGYDRAETEVVQRTLRVKAQGEPPHAPAPSTWQVGTGPSRRAAAPVEMAARTPQPAALRPAPQPVNVAHEPQQPDKEVAAVERAPVAPASPLPQEPSAAVPQEQTESSDLVAAKILALVAEQTGYPEEMLDLDLDMEADLGIDTVKQAETFAAIQEEFGIAAGDDLTLRDYNTLEKVIAFVKEMRPDLAVPAKPTIAPALREETGSRVAHDASDVVDSSPTAATEEDLVTAAIISLVAEQTGYPADMLDLDLDLEADLGVDTVKQAETFAAIQKLYGIPARDDLSLREYNTLEKVIAFVKEMRPDLTEPFPPPTTVAEAVEEAAAPETADGDPVAATIIALVSEQTGYPADMLDLDLDLEADLGIDTVKQAETFLAIREAYGIPQQDDLSLRDYDTLEKVIAFVYEMRPDLKADGTPSLTPPRVEAPPPTATVQSDSKYALEDADRVPRRVPAPSMRPPLSLCKQTGVTLDTTSRIVLMPDQGGVAKALTARLEKLGVAVLQLDPQSSNEEVIEQLQRWRQAGTIQGVYWLPALDVEALLPEMTWDEWRRESGLRIKKLYHTMRTVYEDISRPNSFLVAATRLGGQFGFGSSAATAPLGGGVAGFSKAYNVEQRLRAGGQGPLVKVVDFEVSRKTAAPADLLIAETLSDPGVVEVGYSADHRYGVTLLEQPAPDGQVGLELNKETVFLITGAAGGITSEIVADLAAASQGTFYLLDLIDLPPKDDPHIRLYRRGIDELKQSLIEAARGEGKRPTPTEINRQIAAIERREAALHAVEAVRQAGGTALYRPADLLDKEGIRRILDEIRGAHGRVDVLVHAAGLLFDRILPEKNPQQFDLVFDVKAEGFFNLLQAAQDLPIVATVCFSSVAGRFGNNGQTDYSAANEVLGKITSSMRQWRPETRGLVIDWTAWGEIGMAARGSVPTVMKAMGIDMLSPAAGVPTVRRELVSGAFRGEILVAGALGQMASEVDESGGLDLTEANRWLQERKDGFPLIGEMTAAGLYSGLQAQTTLDPRGQPFLFDHRPDEDTPWLPGVMATEALVELATLFAPDYAVAAVENVEMLGAFKFFRNQPRILYLSGLALPAADGNVIVRATLRSRSEPQREGLPARIQDHFRARIRLAPGAAATAQREFTPPETTALPTTAARVYEHFFHGPAYQVIERIGVDSGHAIALMARDLPPELDGGESHLRTAPRLVELCFQAAAHWNREVKQAMAFPLGFGRLTVFRQASDKRLYALVAAKEDGRLFDADVVDEDGTIYVQLRDYRTVSRPRASGPES